MHQLSFERMMADEESLSRATGPSAEHNILMQNPEVRRQMDDMIREHRENRVDMKIPALGGKAPRDAVLTSDGIEAVEALLAQGERSWENDPYLGEMNREGTRPARKIPGLMKPWQAADRSGTWSCSPPAEFVNANAGHDALPKDSARQRGRHRHRGASGRHSMMRIT